VVVLHHLTMSLSLVSTSISFHTSHARYAPQADAHAQLQRLGSY
jgi:hypothetical protein